MFQDLILPPKAREKIVLPSYVKLDMAFDGADDAKLYDKSRYCSHGDISGASWATGLHGKALDFVSATPSYVEIPASYDQLDFTSEDFSIIIRVYIDNRTITRTLFSRGNYDEDGYYFNFDLNGRVYATTSQASANQLSYTATETVIANTHYTIGFSRAGTSIIPCVNGVDASSVVGSHTNPLTSARSAKIGIRDNKTSEPYDGKIEFLRVFGGIALPASTHLAYHNALK